MTRIALRLLLALLIVAAGPVACGGSSGSDDDPVDVPPDVTITEPDDGAVFDVGALVTLRGFAVDFEDGPIDANMLRWSSSIDGNLGAGDVIRKTDFTYGLHTISLSTVDILGQQGTASIEITILPPLKSIAPGDLVVSEIMVTPSKVDDADGEYFEIYNPTESRIELQGLSFGDLGGNAFPFSGSFELWPKEFFLFAPNRDAALNGGLDVDYAYPYSAFQLDDADEIIVTMGAMEIDRVAYDPSWPYDVGEAMGLSEDEYDYLANDLPANWCVPLGLYGAGDRGTPGAANPVCP